MSYWKKSWHFFGQKKFKFWSIKAQCPYIFYTFLQTPLYLSSRNLMTYPLCKHTLEKVSFHITWSVVLSGFWQSYSDKWGLRPGVKKYVQWNHIVQFFFFTFINCTTTVFYDPNQVSIDVNVHITTDPNLRANRHAQPLHSQLSCQPLKPNLYQRFTKTDPPMLCHGNSCNAPDWLATCLLSTVIGKYLKDNFPIVCPIKQFNSS